MRPIILYSIAIRSMKTYLQYSNKHMGVNFPQKIKKIDSPPPVFVICHKLTDCGAVRNSFIANKKKPGTVGVKNEERKQGNKTFKNFCLLIITPSARRVII